MANGAAAARPIEIGLLWHSADSGNLGVGALTIANMRLARQAAARVGLDPRFTIIGVGGDQRRYVDADDFAIINGRFMARQHGYRRLLDRLDCVLDIGAGDSFTDIYGPKRFTYLWLTKWLALKKGIPLCLSPQTIGPFSGRMYRRLASSVLQGADLVFPRDPMSMEALRALRATANAIQSVDVAFALPFDQQPKACERIRIGINVSGMLFNESRLGTNRYGLSYDYADLSVRLLRQLSGDPRYQVELICHVSSPRQLIDDDSAVADELAREFPSVVRVPEFESPSGAKSHISGLDFLIAGRMHACIAAYSSGVPFVATAYSRKFTGLFGMLDYSGILPRDEFDTDQALARIVENLEQRDRLKSEIESGSECVSGLLATYEDALVSFFQRAARS